MKKIILIAFSLFMSFSLFAIFTFKDAIKVTQTKTTEIQKKIEVF